LSGSILAADTLRDFSFKGSGIHHAIAETSRYELVEIGAAYFMPATGAADKEPGIVIPVIKVNDVGNGIGQLQFHDIANTKCPQMLRLKQIATLECQFKSMRHAISMYLDMDRYILLKVHGNIVLHVHFQRCSFSRSHAFH
jgi:hypothetical protein